MKRYLPLLIILLSLVAVLFPLVRPGFFVSDDGEWMIIRLSAFYQALAEGQFPVRFLGRLNHSYGYPVANFLYPGYLYIGSLLHAIGLPFILSVKIILAGAVTGAAICIYAWLKKYFHSIPAAAGAASFVVLPYIGFDLYTRGSVGEILAFLAVAMCVFSISWNKRGFFAASFALLILAHNSLALLFSLMLFTYLLQEQKVRLFFAPMLLGLGMSAFFWIPALYERSLTRFSFAEVARSGEYFLSIKMFYLIGSALLVCGLSLLTWVKHRRVTFFGLWTFAAIFLASPWSELLWRSAFLHQLFQFPFRFLSIFAVSVPFLVAAIFEFCPKRLRMIVVFLFLGAGIFDVYRTFTSFRPIQTLEESYVTNEATTTVQDEYLPIWVNEKLSHRSPERIVFFEGSGTITPKIYSGHTFRVVVDAAQDSVLQINTIYYPGWGVAIDGRGAKIMYDNPAGLIRVPIASGTHTVEVAFRETFGRFIVDCVTLVSLVFFVLFLRKRK